MKKKLLLVIVLSVLVGIFAGCGDSPSEKKEHLEEVTNDKNVASISKWATDREKYENFLDYSDDITYELPYDLLDFQLKSEKDYKKYLKKNLKEGETLEHEWNWHVYVKYYKPSYYYIRYKKDGDWDKYIQDRFHSDDDKKENSSSNDSNRQSEIDAGMHFFYYDGTGVSFW